MTDIICIIRDIINGITDWSVTSSLYITPHTHATHHVEYSYHVILYAMIVLHVIY